MNPIFIDYYSHEQADCYKINLPWPKYHKETLVLCPITAGEDRARQLAELVLTEHLRASLLRPITRRTP